jgi:glutamine synthetase
MTPADVLKLIKEKESGVFTDDLIDAYIDLKMKEVTRLRMTTHPIKWRCTTAFDVASALPV